MLSAVISDLLTGRYLISKRSDAHKELLKEVIYVINKVNKNENLSDLDKTLLKNMSGLFYEGIPDMSEQLDINKDNLNQLLN